MAQENSRDRDRGRNAAASEGRDQRQGKQQRSPSRWEGAHDAVPPGKDEGSTGRSHESEDLKSISSQADQSEQDLNALQQEELSGSDDDTIGSANYSDTDEDENEGLGNGELGRTVRRGLEE